MNSLRCVVAFLGVASLSTGPALAYDSGSTGADGALCLGDRVRSGDGLTCVPGTGDFNLVVPLPPSGILNYTTVYVSAGATLRFLRNAANTPVYLLASGDVAIWGTIDVSGGSGTCALTTGYTPTADADLLCWGGIGGPGGDDGGSFGVLGPSDGLGPDAGGHAGGAIGDVGEDVCAGGGGAGPTTQGQFGACRVAGICVEPGSELAGVGWKYTHGGGGGGAGLMYWGDEPSIGDVEAGGGGGGALIIASSGRIQVFGTLFARGGARGAHGGGGGGGLLRLVADEVTSHDGTSQYTAGLYAESYCQYAPWSQAPFCTPFADGVAACGAPGVIEVETLDASRFWVQSTPTVHYGSPRTALPWGESQAQQPRLTITKIAELAVPALPPTAHPHRQPLVTLPTGVALTVEIEAAWVPTTVSMFVGVNTVGLGRTSVGATVQPGGTLASSVWHAVVTVPANTRLGDLQAWVPRLDVVE